MLFMRGTDMRWVIGLIIVLFLMGCKSEVEVMELPQPDVIEVIDTPSVQETVKITEDELVKHDYFKDCWIVYEGRVYDFTDADIHPNMVVAFFSHCGKISGFEEGAKDQHSSSNQGRVERYGIYVGELVE